MHQLGSILTKRLRLNFNDNFGLQECWSQEVSLMSYNMEGTVNFIVTECSIEDFFWLGEVFEDVAKETKSQAFVECLYKKLATITEAEYNSQVFSIILTNHMPCQCQAASFPHKNLPNDIHSAVLQTPSPPSVLRLSSNPDRRSKDIY